MLQELNQENFKDGLSMNIKKTKIMKNEVINDNINIIIGGNESEIVQKYIYLGQLISATSTSKEQEIKRRITMGWQAFGRASSIFKNKDIPITHKRKVYNQCILPSVTYGVETWNLTRKEVIKVRTMQRAHERIMLKLTWCDRKTAEWIRIQTKVRDIM